MYWMPFNRQLFHRASIALCAALLLLCAVGLSADDKSEQAATPEAVQPSAEKAWDIPLEVLRLQIKYLSVDELNREAKRWYQLLKLTVRQLNQEHVKIWYENQKLAEAEESASGSAPAQQASADRKIDRSTEIKDRELDKLSALREQRVKVIDRLNVVLDSLSEKQGLSAEGDEQENVLQYRRYADAVKGLKLDVSDSQSLRTTAFAWLKSPEGGLRLARHFGQFLAIVAGFWLLSILLGRAVGKAMGLSSSVSQILRKFVTDSVRRITIIVGLILGLQALEVNVTPLIAVIGAAGFVIAFALQNTLSNFASGLMIMLYKPFDIGDFVQTSEVAGSVRSMTLVTTNVMTPDNKLMIVPNNELWGKVITNVTGSSERRVDLVFGIAYDDDIALAERILAEVVAAHPLVLKEPEPVIRVSELADSSVNLICRPWVKTPDYWQVHGELTRAVKERFDAEGISIPFPQRDVHVHTVAKTDPET